MTTLLESSLKLRVALTTLIIAIACAFCGYIGYAPSFDDPIDLNSLEREDFKQNLVVEGNFNIAFGPFFETYYIDDNNKKSDYTYYYLLASDENQILYSASTPVGSRLDTSINRVMDVYFSDAESFYSSTIKGIIKKTPNDVIDAQKQTFNDPEIKEAFPENFYDDYVVHFTIEPYDYRVAMYLTYGGLIVTFISMLLVISFYSSEKKKHDYAITRESSMQSESRFGRREYETRASENSRASAHASAHASTRANARANSQVNSQNPDAIANELLNNSTGNNNSKQAHAGYVVLEKRKGEKEASDRTLATLMAEEQSRYIPPTDINGDGVEDDISSYFVDDIDYNADIKEKEEEERQKLMSRLTNGISELEKEKSEKNDEFKDFFTN